MAFDDRYNEWLHLAMFLVCSIAIGWPLSNDLGWFGVWRFAGFGLGAVMLALFIVFCALLGRLIELLIWLVRWWSSRNR